MTHLDAADVKARLDQAGIQAVLQRLGVKKFESGGPKNWKISAPYREDKHPSVSISHESGLWNDYARDEGGSIFDLVMKTTDCTFPAAIAYVVDAAGIIMPNGAGSMPRPHRIASYTYEDEQGQTLFTVDRMSDHNFYPKQADGSKGYGDRRVLYHLSEILAADDEWIVLCEGEKDADNLRDLGFIATTSPGGSRSWKAGRKSYVASLTGKRVAIVPDNDDPGWRYATDAANSLHGRAAEVRVVELPDLGPRLDKHGKDMSDWLDAGHPVADLARLTEAATPWEPTSESVADVVKVEDDVSLADFRAYLPEHKYIFIPTRELWPAASVNARLGPVGKGGDAEKAAAWLDRHQAVEQTTWAPGEDLLIDGRLISYGGWIERPGVTIFNLYRAPTIVPGDPDQAGPWLDHVRRVYPAEADHLLHWLAHRVQRPQEKINHAIVLGGQQGIGKDTLLEPVKHAVGPWNFHEVSPMHLLGRFNGFAKSVVLRVSEARDLGDVDRFKFYEHLKAYTAAPPDVLRCDEKHLREHAVLNVCGVIITTNHKTDGIYLPADDRRHFVAWSDLTIDQFNPAYWNALYAWYEAGGYRHVAAYLAQRDLANFNAKAPPPKTPAFWDIVDANRAPEDAELVDALDFLAWPDAVTLDSVKNAAEPEFTAWLRDRRNSRQIPYRMEAAGYVPVRNDGTTDGRWKVGGKNLVIYARCELTIRDRIVVARSLAEATR